MAIRQRGRRHGKIQNTRDAASSPPLCDIYRLHNWYGQVRKPDWGLRPGTWRPPRGVGHSRCLRGDICPAESQGRSYPCQRIGTFLPQTLHHGLCLCGMKLTGIQPTHQTERLSQICVNLQNANMHYGIGRGRGCHEASPTRHPVIIVAVIFLLLNRPAVSVGASYAHLLRAIFAPGRQASPSPGAFVPSDGR